MTNIKKNQKIIFSFVIILSLLFSMFALPVSAASTSSQKVVSYNAVAGGKISQVYHTYTIKGNLLSQKSVKICKNGGSSLVTSLAVFDVKVHDKNGTLKYEYRNLKIGNSFRLPKGNQNYTIYVCSKFQGYNIHSNSHNSAALAGSFYLKY